MNDFRFFRQVLKHGTFTAVTVLTLALGGGRSVVVAKGSSAAPPFSIQQRDQTSWFVKPDGEPFFSFGVCCVNQGASRTEFDAANPGYAAWQHYTDSNLWAK